MSSFECYRIERATDQLRAAILFGNWKDARLALEALEDLAGMRVTSSAFDAAQGRCEFCPNNGGGCCVCGGGLN
jgi:hypothetical protein